MTTETQMTTTTEGTTASEQTTQKPATGADEGSQQQTAEGTKTEGEKKPETLILWPKNS